MLSRDSAEIQIAERPQLSKGALLSLAPLIASQLDSKDHIHDNLCKRLLTDAREVVVVQLQFLDLMIRKKDLAVPLDAVTRADLIDLMARGERPVDRRK